MANNSFTKTVYHTPLFDELYRLFCSWHIRCDSIPKRDRLTIGIKVENSMLEILISIVTAYHTKDGHLKLETLSEANIALEGLKILIRLAKDIHALDAIWYVKYEGQLQEIGKMVGGWMVSIQKTNR